MDEFFDSSPSNAGDLEEIEQLKKKCQKLKDCLEDFQKNGTRQDVNPTGQFKDCGCFDSIEGDSWQGYIKRMDNYVRQKAGQVLKEFNDMEF